MDDKQIIKADEEKRTYNVFLHLHTVSGIAISFALFVCFFAGAFAIFQDDINHWETNTVEQEYNPYIDYERTLKIIEKEGYKLEGRTFNFRVRNIGSSYISVGAPALEVDSTIIKQSNYTPKDSLADSAINLKISQHDYSVLQLKDRPERIGHFLYRLHFFDQIRIFRIGRYICGFMALFFLFAIITGLIIHWKKIISNFFTFRLKGSFKNIWKDSHTALGVIGLPFQFMYAVTGCLYGLSLIILIPAVVIIFEGDQNKLFAEVSPENKIYATKGLTLDNRENINDLSARYLSNFENKKIQDISVSIGNYGDESAYFTISSSFDDAKDFLPYAYVTYKLIDGSILSQKKVDENPYQQSVLTTMGKLHFATYGGYFVKAIYFILAMITCYVILSGVMIWLESRTNNRYKDKKKFIANIGATYLGICLGLYPSVALLFILIRLFPTGGFSLFFIFWLLYTIYGIYLKDYKKINRNALFLAGIFGFAIPFVNGFCTGFWLWETFSNGLYSSFFVDIAWLILASTTLFYIVKTRQKKNEQFYVKENTNQIAK